MSAFAFVLLMMLLARAAGGSSLLTDAAHAAADAIEKGERARQTGNAADAAAAAAAAKKAAAAAAAAKKSQAAAKAAPAPWPQAMPSGLPPFPVGWVPDEPPPQAVQTRAWQLLPQLWKQGPNARKTEKTQGRWITYVAQKMGPKKGVVAYRMREGAAPEPTRNA